MIIKFTRPVNTIVLLLIAVNCSTEESINPSNESFSFPMIFDTNNPKIVCTVHFSYSERENQYLVQSNDVEIRRFINSQTKETILAFFQKQLPSGKESPAPIKPYEIKKGYVGYSPATGCWLYGTLYIDNKGNSLFVPASGMDALLNPPLCGYWYA